MLLSSINFNMLSHDMSLPIGFCRIVLILSAGVEHCNMKA